jgi:hypothetical protein
MSSIFNYLKDELKFKIFETAFIEGFILSYGKDIFGEIPINVNQANRFDPHAKTKFDTILDANWETDIYNKYFNDGYAKFYVWFCLYTKLSCRIIDHIFCGI